MTPKRNSNCRRLATRYFLFGCALLIGTANATDVYKASAIEDSQGKLRCRKAISKARYDESLTTARFTKWEKSEPRIDWQNQAAIIVAPQIYFESMELSFGKATPSVSSVEFSWDFVKATPQQVVVATGGMTSMGSTTQGPEILVIVVPKSLVDEKEVSCHGPERVSN